MRLPINRLRITRAKVRAFWNSPATGLLDGVFAVKAVVGVDEDDQLYPGLSVSLAGAGEAFTWGGPIVSMSQAMAAAEEHLKQSVPLGVVLGPVGHTADRHQRGPAV